MKMEGVRMVRFREEPSNVVIAVIVIWGSRMEGGWKAEGKG